MRRLAILLVAALASWTAPAMAAENDVLVVITNKAYKTAAITDVDDVPYAHRDGEEFRKAAHAVLGVPDSVRNVLVVRDADVAVLRELFEKPEREGGRLTGLIRDKKARIFVYYSGHGVPARRADGSYEPVLLPVGVRPEAADLNGYPLAKVRDALLTMRAKFAPEGQVYLFLDACFSGRSPSGGDIIKGASAGAIPVTLAGPVGIVELAAAQGDQVAWWDPVRQHGLFSDALVDAIFSADSIDRGGNGDGHITLGEIERFVRERMQARLGVMPPGNRRQTPAVTGDQSHVVASIAGTAPVRDAYEQRVEQQRCELMKSETSPDEIDRFLADCRTCTLLCVNTLRASAKSLRDRSATSEIECKSNRTILEDLFKKGDIERVRAFLPSIGCAAVKTEAQRWIDDKDGTAARVAAEAEKRKRDEAAAVAAAEKKQKDDAAAAALKKEADRLAAIEAARKRAEDDRAAAEQVAVCDGERERLQQIRGRFQGLVTKKIAIEFYYGATCETVKSEAEAYLRARRWMR